VKIKICYNSWIQLDLLTICGFTRITCVRTWLLVEFDFRVHKFTFFVNILVYICVELCFKETFRQHAPSSIKLIMFPYFSPTTNIKSSRNMTLFIVKFLIQCSCFILIVIWIDRCQRTSMHSEVKIYYKINEKYRISLYWKDNLLR
jgi:hypothetical protein